MTDTLYENLCIFFVICGLILFIMRNFWTKFVEKIKAHFMSNFTKIVLFMR